MLQPMGLKRVRHDRTTTKVKFCYRNGNKDFADTEAIKYVYTGNFVTL